MAWVIMHWTYLNANTCQALAMCPHPYRSTVCTRTLDPSLAHPSNSRRLAHV